jgi:hypothetical protein
MIGKRDSDDVDQILSDAGELYQFSLTLEPYPGAFTRLVRA